MSFLKDIAKDLLKEAVGTAIGTTSIRKEERKQTEIMGKEIDRQKREENIARHRKKVEMDTARSAAIKENQERRKKGLPEKPLPPGGWTLG